MPSSVSINVVYPANWFTTTTPTTIACQYFDPAAITVPADPATLKTAVMIKADTTTTYQDALTAATNPADWTVLTNEPVTIGGLPATRLQATAKISTPEVSAGATRYGYLIDAAGTSALDRNLGDRRRPHVHHEHVGRGPDRLPVDPDTNPVT